MSTQPDTIIHFPHPGQQNAYLHLMEMAKLDIEIRRLMEEKRQEEREIDSKFRYCEELHQKVKKLALQMRDLEDRFHQKYSVNSKTTL